MRASDLHLQRSTETEGLGRSCLRQSPPESTRVRHSAKVNTRQGITCDDHLSDVEIARLQGWLESHHALRAHWPFDELTARLEAILRDSVIDEDERAERLEWCADLSLDTNPAYELIDRTTRQLHGVLHGIQSDGKVTEDEVYGLRDWLEHFHIFEGTWPFSDAFALVERILDDGHVSAEELEELHAFCMQFAERPTNLRPVDEQQAWWAQNAAPYLQPVGYICQDDVPVSVGGSAHVKSEIPQLESNRGYYPATGQHLATANGYREKG